MLKNKHFKLLGICVLILIALTVISRATDSITVAKVNAEPAKRGVLTQRTTVNGEIDASKKQYVRGTTAFMVEEILVGQGSAVEAGDVLFLLDMHDVNDQAEKIKTELDNLDLEIRKMQLESGGNNSAVNSARAELERARADDEFNKSINDGMQMQADKRKIEDAERKLEEATKSSSKNNIDIEIKNNGRQAKKKEYDEVLDILKNEGKILSPIRGTVGEIFVTQGETMKGENYCTVIPESAHYVFTGKINTDDAQYMKTGSFANIALSGKSRPIVNLLIKSLARDEDVATVIVDLPQETDTYPGQRATLTHEQRSEEYRNVIPLAAVRGSEDDYYVYIIRDVSGVLGVQKTAVKVSIEVIEKDKQNAAVEGGFQADDLIIIRSNKMISEGDRVRVQSSEVTF